LSSTTDPEALRRAARRFGTPLYVTDLAALAAAAAEVHAAFPDPWLRQYSVKANDVPAIVGAVAAHGYGANVVSRGEWAAAAQAGLSNREITLEGIGKTAADLRAAATAARDGRPLRWVSIESPDEAAALADIVRRVGTRGATRGATTVGGRATRGASNGVSLDVLYRLNPDVAPETLPGLAVGAGSSKFGMTETELALAIEAGGGPDGPLRPRGIHLHVGSQLGAVDAWRDAVRRALAVTALWRGSIETFDTLDVGGGFPVFALGEPAPSPGRFARELPALLEAMPPDRRPARLSIEPGRFLVARAGWLIASVLHARDRGGRQVVLDAGMTELIRPALYGARHPIMALTSLGIPIDGWGGVGRGGAGRGDARRRRGDEEGPIAPRAPTQVEGPVCESTDSLGLHDLPPLRRGDLVAIADAGAYAASQSSTYNGRPRPPQVLLEADGTLRLGRRRAGPAVGFR
jgi:diaminopimelate decarboxylase